MRSSFLAALLAFSALILLTHLFPFSASLSSSGASVEKNSLKVNFVLSEPCSLVQFIDAVAGRQHTTTWLQRWYADNSGAEKQKGSGREKKILANYVKYILQANGENYKEESGRQLNLNQRILCSASESASTAELLSKVKSYASKKEYEVLKNTIVYFEPGYKKLVWEAQKEILDKQFSEFKKQALECKLSERLEKVRNFADSKWNPELPFVIVLTPLPDPGEHGHTHGESLGRVQVVELLPHDEYSKKADVVFHELCHAIWHTKSDLDSVRKKFGEIGGDLAYAELNEGLATALGQGWYSKKAFGKPQKSWYAEPMVDKYSRALYPLVCKYLDNDLRLDDAFINEAAAIFQKNFPDAEKQIELTSEIAIFAENMPKMAEFMSELNRALPRLHSSNISCPLDAKESVESFKTGGCKHIVFLLPAAEVKSLEKLGFDAKFLKELQTKISRSADLANGQSVDLAKRAISRKYAGHELLFCFADTPEKQQAILFAVLKNKYWPDAN